MLENTLDILEQKAKNYLPKEIYDHIAGGSGDEITLRRNREAFSEINLIPWVLHGNTKIDITNEILGIQFKAPIIIAPTAAHALVSDEKEIGTAKGAEQAGCNMVVSMMANVNLEQIANAVNLPLWFQLHIHNNHEITSELIKRAEASGYKAIVITVDIPQIGKRYRDIKNEFKLPVTCVPANFVSTSYDSSQGRTVDKINTEGISFNPSASWEDIKWIKSITKLPLLLKGIMHPADAIKALNYGVDGLIVSNHGGRQLDGCIATIEALPQIAEAIACKIPILVDGGIRTGTDILKAIALGADAVLIGRPVLWGLAVSGQKGVCQILTHLVEELIHAMQLVGCCSIADIKRQKNSIISANTNLANKMILDIFTELKNINSKLHYMQNQHNKIITLVENSGQLQNNGGLKPFFLKAKL